MELNTKIFINGIDKSNILQQRIVEFTILEHESIQLDTLELIIDNADQTIIPPNTKASIELAIGFNIPYKMGKYIVTFININERTITLKGVSQDLTLARIKQNRVFEQKFLKDILNKIANSLGLSLKLGNSLSNKQIPYLLQSNKSDLSLLAELGELYYAVANIKNNELVFIAKDATQEVLIIADGLIQSIKKEDTEYKVYNGVKAHYWDFKTATKQEITLGSAPYLIVPIIYGLELTKELVKSKYKEIKEQEIIELTLLGTPELQAGLTIEIPSTSGYEDYKGRYKIKTTKHQFDGEYFTTFVTAYKL